MAAVHEDACDLAGFKAPVPGDIMLVSRDEDGAIGYVNMPREVFESLGRADSLDPAAWTRVLDEAKDELRRRAT